MEKLRRSFRSSFRKKNYFNEEENINRTTWPKDEAAVKTNTCSFEVKYLGCIEVFESRGMQICEEALKLLKNSKRRPIRGTLHVSGDGLRVVDFETVGLVLDQTIEKVSFCAPDRYYEKGFSYICRDGTTRRWMCHGFLALHDSGERLSHAVGCAFAICLEKKQQREKECSVQFHYNKKDNTFVRFGSFHQGSISERLQDPQGFKPCNPPPAPKEPISNPHAVARPKASDMYLRQASMRGIGQLPGNSLFKRQYSLRLDQLPSNLLRQQKSPFHTDQSPQNNMRGQLNSLPAVSTGQNSPCLPIEEDPNSPVEDITGPFSTVESNVGPISLPAVFTDDIPSSLPPPLLSPIQGSNTPRPTTLMGCASGNPSYQVTSPRPQQPSPVNPFSPLSCKTDASNSRSPGPSPKPRQSESFQQINEIPKLVSVANVSPLVSRVFDPVDPVLKGISSLVVSPEGTNPWDNVPDQPLLRLGGTKTWRPVSMVEAENSCSAAFPTNPLERGYLSLDNSINQSDSGVAFNSIQEFTCHPYSALKSPSLKDSVLKKKSPSFQNGSNFTERVSPSDHPCENSLEKKSGKVVVGVSPDLERSEKASCGILQDPFDSDWAELALRTKQDENSHYKDNTLKAFELKM